MDKKKREKGNEVKYIREKYGKENEKIGYRENVAKRCLQGKMEATKGERGQRKIRKINLQLIERRLRKRLDNGY